MDIIITCLILLLAVVASSWVARALPVTIPLPIVQIAIGGAIAHFTNLEVAIDPHVFFALFIAALLFLEAWRIPKDDLFKDAGTVLELAVVLVFVTVVGVGYVIHLLIPTLPLPLAFALAAVLAPTDPVAVSAITSKLHMPKRLHHILEGEALINDASGLSAFRIAIIALVTGHFTLAEAASEFATMALGGVAAGVGVTFPILWIKNQVAKRFGEDQGSSILISILIPFAAFFAAEHYHYSGVLAAAAAGILMGLAEMRGTSMASIRVRRSNVWDMIAFCANGVIFVLLGEQLPKIWDSAGRAMREAGGGEAWWLGVYALIITAILLTLRFVWCWVSFRFTTFRTSKTDPDAKPMSWRLPAVAAVAGVRGSITLAGVMMIPIVMPDGSAVQGRDLAILLASGVIITTMLFASLVLPSLLKGLVVPVDDYQEKLNVATAAAAQAAIQAVERKAHTLSNGKIDTTLVNDAAGRVMELYHDKASTTIDDETDAEHYRESQRVEHELRLVAIAAEREVILRMARTRQIPEYAGKKIARDLDMAEAKMRAEL